MGVNYVSNDRDAIRRNYRINGHDKGERETPRDRGLVPPKSGARNVSEYALMRRLRRRGFTVSMNSGKPESEKILLQLELSTRYLEVFSTELIEFALVLSR